MSRSISVTEKQGRYAWSLREVGELVGASERFLRNEVRRGNLKIVRRSRRVFVTAQSLADYLHQE
jgi:hypothetical protein